MPFVDSHNHLDLPAFDADRAAVLDRARAAGVVGHLIAGVDRDGWIRQRRLAADVPGVRWTAGLHPQIAAGMTTDAIDAALDGLPRCFDGPNAASGVGETGLDRLFVDPASMDVQIHAFRAQLALARELEQPLVLHIVKAHGAALDVLKADGVPPAGGVIHSYSGNAELARQYVKLGLCIGFVGAVCRPNARKLHAAAAAVPDDRLLIETDAPDQSPPGGPKRNEPAALIRVAEAVAAIRNCHPDRILSHSTRNAERLFGVFYAGPTACEKGGT